MTTQKRLMEVVSYCPRSGVFTYLCSGKHAGSMRGPYIRLKIDGKCYAAHRMAWLYQNGSQPQGEIDHIDGNKTNNALCNLRDVDISTNRQNLRSAKSNNTTGLLGVSFHAGSYRARIRIDGVQRNLGRFKTKEQAFAVYLEAKRKIHKGCTL